MQWVVEILNRIHTNNSKIDTTSNQTLTNKNDMIKQKITPCLWVETKMQKQ